MLSITAIMAMLPCASNSLTIGSVETVATGFEFTEGPIWMPSGELLFSDIDGDTIYKVDHSVFRKPSGKSNGLTLDRKGRLIACEHWNRRVTRSEKNGTLTVLAYAYQGKTLNSPNDVVVRSDGSVFFTDPPYGLEGRPAELSFSGVYILRSDGGLELLIDDFVKPNGLAFSPDEKVLYIADTEKNHLRAFDVAPDGTLSNGRVFCKLDRPDGLKVDKQGNVWSTSLKGVEIFNAQGQPLSTVSFPELPANCAFGDPDGKTLYVTARTSVYKIRCTVEGIHP